MNLKKTANKNKSCKFFTIGFSYTNDGEAGIARNQEEVASVLYEVMRQFYIINPELKDRDLYITGESYGGNHLLRHKSPTLP